MTSGQRGSWTVWVCAGLFLSLEICLQPKKFQQTQQSDVESMALIKRKKKKQQLVILIFFNTRTHKYSPDLSFFSLTSKHLCCFAQVSLPTHRADSLTHEKGSVREKWCWVTLFNRATVEIRTKASLGKGWRTCLRPRAQAFKKDSVFSLNQHCYNSSGQSHFLNSIPIQHQGN